jgi:hypothetical protein
LGSAASRRLVAPPPPPGTGPRGPTAVAHPAAPPCGSRAPGANPAPARVSLHVTELAGAMRKVVDAFVRLCSAYFLSVLPPQLPMESDHGEHLHLLSERLLVMGHCPRAHQRSRDIIRHEWSAQGPLNSPLGRAACARPPQRADRRLGIETRALFRRRKQTGSGRSAPSPCEGPFEERAGCPYSPARRIRSEFT